MSSEIVTVREVAEVLPPTLAINALSIWTLPIAVPPADRVKSTAFTVSATPADSLTETVTMYW